MIKIIQSKQVDNKPYLKNIHQLRARIFVPRQHKLDD